MGKKASERSMTYGCAGSPVKKGRVKSTSILEFGFIVNAINATVWNRDTKPSVVYADLTFAGKDPAENGTTTKGPPCGQTRNAKGYEFAPAVYDQTLIGLMEKRGFERFTRFYTDASGCDIELIYQDCWVKFCDYNITNDELNALVEETQKFIDSLLPIWEANKKLGILDANNDWTLTPNNAFNVIKGKDRHLHEVIAIKDILEALSDSELARSFLGVDKAMSAALTTTAVPKQDIMKKLDTLGQVIYGYPVNMHTKFVEIATPPVVPQAYTPKK